MKEMDVPSGRVSTSDELEALAARCEHEEPTSTLNIAIARAVGWTSVVLGYVVWRNPSGRDSSLPNFVGSLDAAVTLVDFDKLGFVTFQRTEDGDWLYLKGRPANDGISIEDGVKSFPMAICAAALRARAALLKQEGQADEQPERNREAQP